MTKKKSLERKSKKIIWKTIQFLLGTFILLICILYFISTSKFKNLVPELITHYAQQRHDINLNFASYETSRSENFPFLTFKMKDLYFENSNCQNCNDKILTVKNLQFKIQPWDLLQNFINIKDLHIEGAKFYLHKEEKIRKKAPSSGESFVENLEKIKLNTISLKDVFLEYQDDVKHKHFGVNFKEASVFLQTVNGRTDVKLDADCLFKGLAFKEENGAFLQNKAADLLLHLEIDEDSIILKNSSLQVAQDKLELAGSYQMSEVPFLDLNISSSGILLENALSLLDLRLQEKLAKFQLDKKIRTRFHLHGPIKPNHRLAIDLDFETENANLILQKTRVTHTDFQASYSNHCQTKSGIILKGEDCLTVHSLEGNLFDTHPIKLSGVIHDLKTLDLEMRGTADLNLPALQPYLTKTSYKLKAGTAALDIDYKGNFRTLLEGKLRQKSGIKIDAKLENTVFNYRKMLFTNVSGSLLIDAQKTKISNFRATHNKTPFLLSGKVDNILEYVFNKRGKLQTNLQLRVAKVDTKNFTSKGTKSTLKKENSNSNFISVIEDLTQSIEGKIDVRIDKVSHQKHQVKNSSFSLFFKEIKDNIYQSKKSDFFQINNLKTTLADSLNIAADIFIENIKNPQGNANFSLKSSFSDLKKFVNNENIELQNGQIKINGNSSFLLKDLENLSAANAIKLNFNGKISLSNASLKLKKTQQKITTLNTNLTISPDSILIEKLNGKLADIPVDLVGNISNYFSLLNEEKTVANANLNLKLGTLDLEKLSSGQKQNQSIVPQTFLHSLEPTFDKINGQVTVSIATLKIPNYPIKNANFKIKSGKNESQKLFLSIENFSGQLYEESPFTFDLKITDFATPKLNLKAKSDMPVTDLGKLLQDDNFQARKGTASIELMYQNDLRDSFQLQDYLLTGEMKASIDFQNAEIYYDPRGLRFSEMNGGVSFTEENLTVDFPKMLFNENVVSLSGESHDFLPFFFEENKDLTVDLIMNSPRINFHNFDTPKTLKEKQITEAQNSTIDEMLSPIDRLLDEGNLSLRTKIGEVVYDNFLAKNIVGRAKINDNEVVLDTFKMRTSDGLFGISSIISDIDKEKIHLTADISLDKINASKVLHSFDNFGQTTLTNNNIIGVVDAEINLSTDLNDNYEVYPDSLFGNLDLTINKGAFIDFNGLTNLDGFLFKKRKLHAVYFDTLHTDISLSGRDMSFAPTVLNSTAATLTVEGVYTFSEEDRTDMVIEVPLGNIFTRYVERAKIRKNHKKRTGLPIIVEVTEKDKILDFNIQLRRDEDKGN